MSDGINDAYYWLTAKGKIIADRDAIDGRDFWDDEEITEIVRDLNKDGISVQPSTYPWLDFANWAPKERTCDCGGKTAKTTHAEYCSTRKL